MVADYKSLIASAKASGLIQVAAPKPRRKPLDHYFLQHARIERACKELLALSGTVGTRDGDRFPYGCIECAAQKYKVKAQSLRNALGRRRQRLEATQ